jgi:1A family penicillin-binding protein
MATASQRSSDPQHDWLIVSSTGAPDIPRISLRSIRATDLAGFLLSFIRRAAAWVGRSDIRGALRAARTHISLRAIRASKVAGFLLPFIGAAAARVQRSDIRGALRAARTHISLRSIEATARTAWRRSRLYAIASLAAVLILLPPGYFLYSIASLPADGGLVIEPTPSALMVQAADGQVFASRGVFKGEKLSAQELPTQLRQAIVAIEDRHFFEHGGIYLPSLIRAAVRNLIAGGTREGGSTITQQLVRMTYLSQERTIKRKVQEAIITLWLERQLPKEEILTRYLNTAYFGAGVYGADAAARRYFGKHARDLSLSEAAMLAGLVRAPSALAPTRNLEGARQRAALVLAAMVATGAISREEAEAARAQPVTLRVPPDNPPGTNYFVDMAAGDVRRLVGAVSTDLTLRTTLDLELQGIAENVIARRLKAEGRGKNIGQAALVAMRPDGAIVAMAGGRDYNESQFNRVTQAKRQPGSLFKLFVYLTALEQGVSLQSTMVDRPVRIGSWEPENYGGRFHGEVTLRTAFAQSINSIAVQLADKVGIPKIIETARRLGVQSDLPVVPSLALGSADVTLMEMTRAFAAIAGNTENVEPYGIDTIQTGDRVVFARQQPVVKPPSNPAARAAIGDLLAAVVREGTGRAARVSAPAAGKTGTSQEYRNAWFVGFTPDVVVGVWVGNDDNSPMRNVTGGDVPARIWNEFVAQAIAARAKSAQARPVTVGAAMVQPASAQASAAVVRGMPVVQSTGVLTLQGTQIRLYGVDGIRGRPVRELQRYLGRREVVCEPIEGSNEHRCRVENQDLSRVVLFNGGGRAAASATPDLRSLEGQARAARAGIWARRGEDDDDD